MDGARRITVPHLSLLGGFRGHTRVPVSDV